MTKKPYYKLAIGKNKPVTSADARWNLGRVRIEISDAHPEAKALMTRMFDVRWSKVLRNMLDYFDTHTDGVLTEPADRPLKAEVARLDAIRAGKANA